MSYLLFLLGGVILGSVGTLVVLKVCNRCHHEFHEYDIYREMCGDACVGVCTRCGSVAVNDGITVKMVKSVTWLRSHAFSVTVPDVITKFWVCDACCAHHRRADYCVCGSGKHYRKCRCRSGTPIYELGKPVPKAIWVRRTV